MAGIKPRIMARSLERIKKSKVVRNKIIVCGFLLVVGRSSMVSSNDAGLR